MIVASAPRPAAIALLVCGAAALAACSSSAPAEPPAQTVPTGVVRVTGSARYLERILLPADTDFVVKVRDLTRSGVVDWIVAERRETVGHRNPVEFDLPVPADQCVRGNRYSVTAAVVVGGRVWAEATEDVPGLADGAPAPLSLTMRRGADPAAPR